MNISNERQNEILGNALDWFSEHYEQKELLNILHDKLGMTDSEIDFFGFDFDSDIEDKKDLSIVHFHNDDEDYCLTTDAPFYLWEAANAYVNTIKDVKDRWSLDSIAENIADGIMIDERIYPILCKSMAPDGNIVSVVDFNLSDNELFIKYNRDDFWYKFHLDDICDAYNQATSTPGLSQVMQKRMFLETIAEKDLQINPDETNALGSPNM